MKKKTLINALSRIFCAAFITTAMAGVAVAVIPTTEASAATETKTEYVLQNGVGTGLSASAGTFADGTWTIPAASWATNKLLYEGEGTTQDMSAMLEKGAKLHMEVMATGEGSYAEVGIVTYANWWDEPVDLHKASLCANEGYNVVEIDISTLTTAQLQKFRGISIKTEKGFSIKNIWFEYDEEVADAPTVTAVKTYLVENGNGTGLTASAGSFADGALTIPAASWATNKILYEGEGTVQDMSAMLEKGAKLYMEVMATGEGSYAEVGIVTYANWWDEPVDLHKASLCANEGYNVVEIDVSTLTAAQLQKFRGVSIKTEKGFSIKNIWFEYTEVSGEVDTTQDVEVLTESKASVQNQSTCRHDITVDLSAYSVKPYDTLQIGYNVASEGYKSAEVEIGGTKSNVAFGTEGAEAPAVGTATIDLDTYTEEQLTSITVGLWSASWEMTSLKIVRGTAPETNDNFALIETTEYVADNIKGNAVMTIGDDNVLSLAAGTGDLDGTNKYTSRIINIATKRLQDALYNEGVIKFSYKAPADSGAESFDFRLFNTGAGGWGELYFSTTPVTLTKDGEWHECTLNLTDVVRNVIYSTWGGTKDVTLNMDSIVAVGFGLTAGSVELKDFNVSYEDKARTISGIEVATQPTKTAYMAGDTFDATGMEVNLVFSDDFTLPLYEYTYSTDALVEGDTSVTITYKDYTATVAVTIENPYNSLAITTQPTKTTYYRANLGGDCFFK